MTREYLKILVGYIEKGSGYIVMVKYSLIINKINLRYRLEGLLGTGFKLRVYLFFI
jgi:hypothetical protein